MERQLLFEDTQLISSIVRDISQFSPALNIVKTCYEKLDIGEFSNEVLQEIINGATSKIEIRYSNALRAQFKAAGITNEAVLNKIFSDAEAPMNEFKKAVQELRGIRPISGDRPVLKLSDIGYKNGKFGVYNSELIAERDCRVYLETEEQINAYKLLKSIASKYEEFAELMKSMGYATFTPFAELRAFLRAENGKLVVNAVTFKNSMTFAAQKQAHERQMKEERSHSINEALSSSPAYYIDVPSRKPTS